MNSDGVIRVSSVALRCVRRPFAMPCIHGLSLRPLASCLLRAGLGGAHDGSFVSETSRLPAPVGVRVSSACLAVLCGLHRALVPRRLKNTRNRTQLLSLGLPKKNEHGLAHSGRAQSLLSQACGEHFTYWRPRTPSPRPLHARRPPSTSARALCNHNSCTASLEGSHRGACPHR